MLALTKDTLAAHEPFNIEPWAYALDGLAKHWFTYAPALPQDAALEAFDKVLTAAFTSTGPRSGNRSG